MGRWAFADHTEASLILLPPVRPLLVALRRAEAGLETKTKKNKHTVQIVSLVFNRTEMEMESPLKQIQDVINQELKIRNCTGTDW